MKKRFRSIIAALTAVTVISFGSMSVSATTAADVVAAARGAGIHSTYVAQLENFLAANEFTSNQYDMMIDGLGNIGNISLSVIKRYFPEINSIEDFYNGPSSSDDSNTDPTDTKKPGTIINGTLTPEEENIKDKTEEIMDNMTNEDMLDAIEEMIETGKQVGLDITAEQVGDKAFTITVKDKDGNIKLVAPIGQLVSRTGVQDVSTESDSNTVAVASLGLLVAGIAGMAFLNRKNRETGVN